MACVIEKRMRVIHGSIYCRIPTKYTSKPISIKNDNGIVNSYEVNFNHDALPLVQFWFYVFEGLYDPHKRKLNHKLNDFAFLA